jgi:hypothetical protein
MAVLWSHQQLPLPSIEDQSFTMHTQAISLPSSSTSTYKDVQPTHNMKLNWRRKNDFILKHNLKAGIHAYNIQHFNALRSTAKSIPASVQDWRPHSPSSAILLFKIYLLQNCPSQWNSIVEIRTSHEVISSKCLSTTCHPFTIWIFFKKSSRTMFFNQ